MPELKLYTISDLREWLEHNKAAEGLSEQVIAPARAWAIVHNPYVKADDPVAAAIFEDGEVAAYTAAFPEVLESAEMEDSNEDNKRYWWFTSLWCAPKHQGKGYGLIVIGSLAEVYGQDCILDRWGAKETVEIFSCLGNQISYSPRYILGYKLNRQAVKGKLMQNVRGLQKMLHRLIELPLKQEDYSLRYLPYIDDETYNFIQSARRQDVILRTQSMLNWVIQYSFTQSCPLLEYTKATTSFAPAKAESNQIYAVQVCDNDEVIGFYIMKHTEADLHILYLYYKDEQRSKVFASVRDHVKHLNIEQFVTEDKELATYIRKNIYIPKYKVVQIHFAHPKSFMFADRRTLQYGDGDGFTAE